MPRVYMRTSRNTGVSFGTLGFLLYALGWMMIATFVVAAVVAIALLALAALLVALVVASVDALIHRDRGAFARRTRTWRGRVTGSGGGDLGQPPDESGPSNQARFSTRR